MLVRRVPVLAGGLALVLWFGCVAGGVAAQATSVGRAARKPIPALVPHAALVSFREDVLNFAVNLGVPSPAHWRAVATNSDAANRVIGPVPYGFSPTLVPIYVGCARGHFTNIGGGVGVSSLCVLVFAQTGKVATSVTSSRIPNLQKLGYVQKL